MKRDSESRLSRLLENTGISKYQRKLHEDEDEDEDDVDNRAGDDPDFHWYKWKKAGWKVREDAQEWFDAGWEDLSVAYKWYRAGWREYPYEAYLMCYNNWDKHPDEAYRFFYKVKNGLLG